jgi:putative phosphoesterase
MRIAVFSDVHGNYLNLISFYESALKLNIDKFICLGDLCNYYPENKKVIDFIKENKIICLLGNHDEFYSNNIALTEEKKTAYNFDDKLLECKEQISFLNQLPKFYEINENGKSLFFCHASPKDLLYTYIYPNSDLSIYDNFNKDIVFIGHTHRQFLRQNGNTIFCNVGSIGLPRDNGSLMGFAVIDTTDFNIVLYRKEINSKNIKAFYSDLVNNDVLDLLERRENLDYNYTLI